MSKTAHWLHDDAVKQQSSTSGSHLTAELDEETEEPGLLELVVVGMAFTTIMTAPIWGTALAAKLIIHLVKKD